MTIYSPITTYKHKPKYKPCLQVLALMVIMLVIFSAFMYVISDAFEKQYEIDALNCKHVKTAQEYQECKREMK